MASFQEQFEDKIVELREFCEKKGYTYFGVNAYISDDKKESTANATVSEAITEEQIEKMLSMVENICRNIGPQS